MADDPATIEALLFDLDGVLYVGSHRIPGAVETLEFCQEQNIPFRFITNTSTRTVAAIADKLNAMGIPIVEDWIFSAASATRDYLLQQGSPSVHLLVRDEVKLEFAEFEQNSPDPDFVVVGDIGAAWNYELLNRVFNELMNGAELIAMHRNKYWLTDAGLQMDIGAFVAGLEYVSGKRATIIGKPSSEFFSLAVNAVGAANSKTAIVGDDIENDIGGGNRAGLQTIMVKTGKYREDVFTAARAQPDYILDSIADLPALLTKH